MHLLGQAILRNIWKFMLEKKHTNAANVALHLCGQEIWGNIWKLTMANRKTHQLFCFELDVFWTWCNFEYSGLFITISSISPSSDWRKAESPLVFQANICAKRISNMLFQPPLTLFVWGSWGDIYCLASGEGANSCAAYHYLALTNHYLSAKRLELIATEVTVRTDPVSKPRCKRQTWWRMIKLFVG